MPCWIIAAYAASILQLGRSPATDRRMRALARQVQEATVPDETTAFFDSFLLYDDLRGGVTPEHIPMIRARCAAIVAFVTMPRVDFSLTRYANAAKAARPIDEVDFAYTRHVSGTDVVLGVTFLVGTIALIPKMAKGELARPPDWRVIELFQELLVPCVRIARIAPLFAELLETPRGSPRAIELARQMQKSRPSELPELQRHWQRLIATRIPLWKRIAMTFS